MTPHAPKPLFRIDAAPREVRSVRLMRDQEWGRPVFRPPALGALPVEFDPNPFRLIPFAQARPLVRS